MHPGKTRISTPRTILEALCDIARGLPKQATWRGLINACGSSHDRMSPRGDLREAEAEPGERATIQK
jgi:hypothetical protein